MSTQIIPMFILVSQTYSLKDFIGEVSIRENRINSLTIVLAYGYAWINGTVPVFLSHHSFITYMQPEFLSRNFRKVLHYAFPLIKKIASFFTITLLISLKQLLSIEIGHNSFKMILAYSPRNRILKTRKM